MTPVRCATRCGRPARGGTICPGCAHRLAGDLRQAPALIRELETTFSRQTASGRTEGGRSAETPLAYGVLAAEALRALTKALRSSARALDPLTLETGQLSAGELAAWLGHNITEVRGDEHAHTMFRRITEAMAKARVVVDRRPDRWYAGPCGFDGDGREEACSTELYAEVGEGYIRCPTCGEQWDVAARRRAIAATVAAALTSLGQEVPAATVRSWARRGKLKVVDFDEKGRPLYRVGEALDIVAATEQEALQTLLSQHVDESSSKVVEDSSPCNTPSAAEKLCPETIESGSS
jgi:uncharacterized Zn finger protein (UPF0148 family)